MNVYESRTPTYFKAFLNRLMAAYSTNPAAALIASPVLHLIQSPGGSFTPDSVVGDFTPVEADYDDYVAAALSGMTIANLDGSMRALSGIASFPVTSATPAVANTIHGYWITSTAGIVCFELFPAGERTALATLGDLLIINFKLPQGPYYSLPA